MINQLILEYLANRLDNGDEILGLGDREIQVVEKGNVPTNLEFSKSPLGDELTRVIQNIIDMYLEDEKKHWEELGKPENHVYNDLLKLKELIN